MEGAVDVANKLGLPLVATSDAHYVDRDDAEAQDVLLCINTGKFRTDTSRLRMDGNEYYLRSPEEMYRAFPGLADAVARSQEIADSVDLELELGQAAFSQRITLPEEKTAEQLSARTLRARTARTVRRQRGDVPGRRAERSRACSVWTASWG